MLKLRFVNDVNPGVLEGSGSASDPYSINCIEDLVAFAYNVNKGDTEYGLYSEKTVVLALDLDFQSDKSYANPETKYVLGDTGYVPNESGTAIKTLLTDINGIGFVPIGNNKSNGFCGIFDGNNHTISNLYINTNDTYGGLFGYMRDYSSSITISNLSITSCNVKASDYAGAVIGSTNATITMSNCLSTGIIRSNMYGGGLIGLSILLNIDNCYNKANVSAKYGTGGIAGWVNSKMTITNCYNVGTITCSDGHGGGIIGSSNTTIKIEKCINEGNVSAKNSTGGIVGEVKGSKYSIAECENKGIISSNSNEYGNVGGIIGNGYGELTIINCNNKTNVSSAGSRTGGIIGSSNSNLIIANCCNNANITGYDAGGIIAFAGGNSSVIKNCYNTKNITGKYSTGGLIGILNTSIAEQSKLINSYNKGNVTSTEGQAGGIISNANAQGYNVLLLEILNSYNKGSITGKTNTGGIIASAYKDPAVNGDEDVLTISYCYNTESITTNGAYPVGGIIGEENTRNATILNCHNTGIVTGNDDTKIGQIRGFTLYDKPLLDCTSGENVEPGTMDMSNFVTRMNEYVVTNNQDNTKPQLKTWTINNEYPVFSN